MSAKNYLQIQLMFWFLFINIVTSSASPIPKDRITITPTKQSPFKHHQSFGSGHASLTSQDDDKDISTEYAVTFDIVQQIGSSNYTGSDGHFWMPQPLFRASSHLDSELLVTVAIHGDGISCPPPDRPFQKCNLGYHRNNINSTEKWEMNVNGSTVPGNSLIRLNDTMTRGFGGLWLNASTNTSGLAFYQDFKQDGSSVTKGAAPITGLPPMLEIAYLQSTASTVLTNGKEQGLVITQFYGYLADAPGLGGCIKVHSWDVPYCSSVITIASKDQGLHWEYRSSIQWDGKHAKMPNDVGGPAEPTLSILPDGKTILSIFRLASNKNLWMTTSTDGGVTFSQAQETNAWSVFPQLRLLGNDALVMTAGRPGIGVWVMNGSTVDNAKGWMFYNLAAAHNTLISDVALQFNVPEVNIENVSSKTSVPVMTKAYTGLEVQGCDGEGRCTLTVTYDRLCNSNDGPPGPYGKKDYAFSMEIYVER